MPSKPHTRKRGAPHGNRNALKHGFYSKQFRKAELKDLEGPVALGLEEEINLLRLLIRTTLNHKNEIECMDEYLDLLRAISLASGSLTRLIKTQYWLSSNQDDTAAAINQALLEIAEEFAQAKNAPSSPCHLEPSQPPN